MRLALESNSEIQRRQRSRQSPPPALRRPPSAATTPPLDLDVAGTDEVAAIPLIGPALARRIVADRIENGPFGSITGLERVRGISAALGRRLAPFVTFSRSPRLGGAGERPAQAKKSAPPTGALRP
ncbi:MAG: ComEA family DNA-binding protein [Gemmatimonadales bacterium]